ncbi:MAG: DUF2235 domain-containing protein [Desulfobacteraceae bacterium]|nr:DUF2235 domain-containing protein [Desulfobacteraceae bacterium]
MPGAARLGDKAHCPEDDHGCPGCKHAVEGPAVTASPDVFIDFKPALRVGDKGEHASCCGPNSWEVTEEGCAHGVFINGRPAAVVGTITQHCGGRGLIIEGSSTVIIGEQTPILEPVVLAKSAPANDLAPSVTIKARTPAVPTPPAPHAPTPASAAVASINQPIQGPTNLSPTPTPKPELVLGVFFDGTDNNMLADPPEKHTNVAKLHDLYPRLSSTFPIYIQGVGTKAVYVTGGGVDKDTSIFGLAMGLGPYGAEGRLKEARQKVIRRLEDFVNTYGGPPEAVTFDVFGFSRGAMLARHFVNMVADGLPDLKCDPKEVRPVIKPSLRGTKKRFPQGQGHPAAPPEADALFPRLKAKVRVRFLGIFDSVGSFYMPGNADEGFVNPYLVAHSAELVYHPVARNEIRHYFPLTSICSPGDVCPANFIEERFFGVHSDVGGGYDNQPEKVLVHKDLGGNGNSSVVNRWQKQMQSQALQKGWHLEFKGNGAYFYEIRHTQPELSRVTLAAMHAKAVTQGVPFRPIKPADSVPSVLSALLSRASAGDAAAEKQLHEQYIRTSHDPLDRKNMPEENSRRRIFSNQPGKAIRVSVTQTTGSKP